MGGDDVARNAGMRQAVAAVALKSRTVPPVTREALDTVCGQTPITFVNAALVATGTPDVEPAPDIFEAIQTQPGLKLQVKTVPLETIVVDHLEKLPVEK